MRDVSIIGMAQLPILKKYALGLREMGAQVVRDCIEDAGISPADVKALYASNMLADELQSQKHIAALLADEAGLAGIEAIQVRAATAAGAAALRIGYLAVASGQVDVVVVVGVEKMSGMGPTLAMAKALDARREVPDGATMVSQCARLMGLYYQQTECPPDALLHFALNAHHNAITNPNAMFYGKRVTKTMALSSRVIVPPIRLYDCSPICDGAAAVMLAPASHFPQAPVQLLASAGATDRFRALERENPLFLSASAKTAKQSLESAGISLADIDFFELHDAFTIMSCLSLEAVGFAEAGQGWRLAMENKIGRNGPLPLSTMGGLKGRGHPIGATALYQVCDIVQQLTGNAGINQLPNSPRIAMMQSIGGVGTTIFTHILGKR